MKLFIIGNGFDIAHGLPTRYTDFRDYLQETNWEFLIKLEVPYGFTIESRRDFVEKMLWKDFETNLSAINEEEIIDGALSIDMGLEGGDVDIEDTLNVYWEEEYQYIKRLNDYVNEWVQKIDIDVLPKTTKIKKHSKDLFLTFNYTLVLEQVYKIQSEKILHIHGSVDGDNDETPVIGHGDNERIEKAKERALVAAENFWEKESSIYQAIVNYYERTRKNVDFFLRYHSVFFSKLSSIEQVNVIGHSWGDVDMPYFRKVLSKIRQNAKWNIYYYEDREKIEFYNKALAIGIKKENVKMLRTAEFYNSVKLGGKL